MSSRSNTLKKSRKRADLYSTHGISGDLDIILEKSFAQTTPTSPTPLERDAEQREVYMRLVKQKRELLTEIKNINQELAPLRVKLQEYDQEELIRQNNKRTGYYDFSSPIQEIDILKQKKLSAKIVRKQEEFNKIKEQYQVLQGSLSPASMTQIIFEIKDGKQKIIEEMTKITKIEEKLEETLQEINEIKDDEVFRGIEKNNEIIDNLRERIIKLIDEHKLLKEKLADLEQETMIYREIFNNKFDNDLQSLNKKLFFVKQKKKQAEDEYAETIHNQGKELNQFKKQINLQIEQENRRKEQIKSICQQKERLGKTQEIHIPNTPKNSPPRANQMWKKTIIVYPFYRRMPQSELKKLFANYLPIDEIRISCTTDDDTFQTTYKAIITFSNHLSAQDAITQMNNCYFDSAILTVRWAEESDTRIKKKKIKKAKTTRNIIRPKAEPTSTKSIPFNDASSTSSMFDEKPDPLETASKPDPLAQTVQTPQPRRHPQIKFVFAQSTSSIMKPRPPPDEKASSTGRTISSPTDNNLSNSVAHLAHSQERISLVSLYDSQESFPSPSKSSERLMISSLEAINVTNERTTKELSPIYIIERPLLIEQNLETEIHDSDFDSYEEPEMNVVERSVDIQLDNNSERDTFEAEDKDEENNISKIIEDEEIGKSNQESSDNDETVRKRTNESEHSELNISIDHTEINEEELDKIEPYEEELIITERSINAQKIKNHEDSLSLSNKEFENEVEAQNNKEISARDSENLVSDEKLIGQINDENIENQESGKQDEEQDDIIEKEEQEYNKYSSSKISESENSLINNVIENDTVNKEPSSKASEVEEKEQEQENEIKEEENVNSDNNQDDDVNHTVGSVDLLEDENESQEPIIKEEHQEQNKVENENDFDLFEGFSDHSSMKPLVKEEEIENKMESDISSFDEFSDAKSTEEQEAENKEEEIVETFDSFSDSDHEDNKQEDEESKIIERSIENNEEQEARITNEAQVINMDETEITKDDKEQDLEDKNKEHESEISGQYEEKNEPFEPQENEIKNETPNQESENKSHIDNNEEFLQETNAQEQQKGERENNEVQIMNIDETEISHQEEEENKQETDDESQVINEMSISKEEKVMKGVEERASEQQEEKDEIEIMNIDDTEISHQEEESNDQAQAISKKCTHSNEDTIVEQNITPTEQQEGKDEVEIMNIDETEISHQEEEENKQEMSIAKEEEEVMKGVEERASEQQEGKDEVQIINTNDIEISHQEEENKQEGEDENPIIIERSIVEPLYEQEIIPTDQHEEKDEVEIMDIDETEIPHLEGENKKESEDENQTINEGSISNDEAIVDQEGLALKQPNQVIEKPNIKEGKDEPDVVYNENENQFSSHEEDKSSDSEIKVNEEKDEIERMIPTDNSLSQEDPIKKEEVTNKEEELNEENIQFNTISQLKDEFDDSSAEEATNRTIEAVDNQNIDEWDDFEDNEEEKTTKSNEPEIESINTAEENEEKESETIKEEANNEQQEEKIEVYDQNGKEDNEISNAELNKEKDAEVDPTYDENENETLEQPTDKKAEQVETKDIIYDEQEMNNEAMESTKETEEGNDFESKSNEDNQEKQTQFKEDEAISSSKGETRDVTPNVVNNEFASSDGETKDLKEFSLSNNKEIVLSESDVETLGIKDENEVNTSIKLEGEMNHSTESETRDENTKIEESEKEISSSDNNQLNKKVFETKNDEFDSSNTHEESKHNDDEQEIKKEEINEEPKASEIHVINDDEISLSSNAEIQHNSSNEINKEIDVGLNNEEPRSSDEEIEQKIESKEEEVVALDKEPTKDAQTVENLCSSGIELSDDQVINKSDKNEQLAVDLSSSDKQVEVAPKEEGHSNKESSQSYVNDLSSDPISLSEDETKQDKDLEPEPKPSTNDMSSDIPVLEEPNADEKQENVKTNESDAKDEFCVQSDNDDEIVVNASDLMESSDHEEKKPKEEEKEDDESESESIDF